MLLTSPILTSPIGTSRIVTSIIGVAKMGQSTTRSAKLMGRGLGGEIFLGNDWFHVVSYLI